jgi:hypothetical protein
MVRGCRAANGTLVRLEHLRVGKRLWTSPQAVERFSAALAAGSNLLPVSRTPTQRNRAAEKADAQLAADGW